MLGRVCGNAHGPLIMSAWNFAAKASFLKYIQKSIYTNFTKLTIYINNDLLCGMAELGRFKTEFFKALAHPLRIAVLDALRNGELGVNELCNLLKVEHSSLSQQISVLRTRNLVLGRKEGLNVYYSVRDATVFKLLDVAKEIFNNHLIAVQDMLSQIAARVAGGR